jgi:hypothetical protein
LPLSADIPADRLGDLRRVLFPDDEVTITDSEVPAVRRRPRLVEPIIELEVVERHARVVVEILPQDNTDAHAVGQDH